MSTLADKSSLADSLLRAVAVAAGAVLIVAAVLVTLSGVKPPLVDRLQVTGDLVQVAPEQVRERVAPYVGQSLLDLDLAAIRRDVEALPWVAAARVERVWPDMLRVQIQEHQAAARWSRGVLSAAGVLFEPAPESIPPGLPRLSGPEGSAQRVLEMYQGLAQALAGTPFYPVALAASARAAWTATTADGIELRFGREDPLSKVEVLRGAVVTALQGELERVAYVDLRYSNGFAVGWQEGEGLRAAEVAMGSGVGVYR